MAVCNAISPAEPPRSAHIVYLRPPIAAVDAQQHGVRSFRARQMHFRKLIRVGAVRYTFIG